MLMLVMNFYHEASVRFVHFTSSLFEWHGAGSMCHNQINPVPSSLPP